MIKCCIFDLDGTLYFTLDSIRYFLNKTLVNYGIEPITSEECRIFVGNGARNLLERCLDSRSVTDRSNFEVMYKEYTEDYDANATYLTVPYDGIVELLDGLKELGVKLAVLSNKPDPTTKRAVAELSPGTFDVVYGARTGVALKPDPEAVTGILAELGVSASETVFIGDTGTDITTGKNFGARATVGVAWGYRSKEELARAGADFVADTPREILDFIKDKLS